jgi:uncharacterized Ntn-hydrolase superfamily protein
VRLFVALSIASVALALPSPAHATWSIVAVDPETHQVGVAVASCVEAPFGSTILPQVAGVVPGIGALAAQAYFDQQLRDFAVQQLADGLAPADVIDAVNGVDNGDELRQYGVVTLDGQTATFTGSGAQDWAGGIEGSNVSVQGNILYGPEVADDALAAFLADAPSCPFTLADRLMLALEAGAAQGGDNRCSMEQSALAAVIIVADAGDSIDAPTLDLRIPSQREGGDNPVALLRAEYDAWRLDNPPDDTGCGMGSSSGAEGGDTTTTSGDLGSEDAGPADDTTTGPSTASDASASDASAGATSASEGSTGDADAGANEDGGCACTLTPGRAPWWLVVLAWRRRQRLRTTL